uniref:Lipid-binding serum glycoprotein C-terminal domain-containing protein n=1 Tax=Parascaris equorum TaxID=6256 RepID=A0A914S1E7_PAREQ
MHFSIESTLRGENFSEAFVNGRCTISSKQTRLNIIVRVRKGTNGSPLIDVHECQADITAPYVIACDMLLPVNMSSLVQSRANNLLLDYGMLTNPITSPYGVEFNSSGEVSVDGKGGTPFGSVSLELPPALKNSTAMLQMVISDFISVISTKIVRTGLFNTRIDPTTPQLGPVMRTTCGFNSGPLFCLGDLLPTLRHFHPNRGIAMIFSSAQPPAIIFRSGNEGAFFAMNGHIAVWAIDDRGVEKRVGDMAIEIEAFAKFRIAGTILKSKLSLEKIHLKSLNSDALQQDELDDAGLLGREIMQKIVNDVLKDGVPIPIHPIFRLRKTKVVH